MEQIGAIVATVIIAILVIMCVVEFVVTLYVTSSEAPTQTTLNSPSHIKCGNLKWALQNKGTNTKNYNREYYTWDNANAAFALPSKKELEQFVKRTYYGFDKKRKVGIFVDRNTGAKLELPANGFISEDNLLLGNGTDGYYQSSTRYNIDSTYFLFFDSSSVGISTISRKYRLSVRSIRR